MIHRRDVAFPSLEVTRELVTELPNARLVLLEGKSLVPFVGDTEPVLNAILGFLADDRAAATAGVGPLTARETEILASLAAGRSNLEIAQDLSISTRTAERHTANIYLKIDAHNRAEATSYAIHHGIGSEL